MGADVHDNSGQLLSATLMDYAVPTFANVPPIGAILNAVNDALAPLGVMLTDQPITPQRVVRAFRHGR